MHDLPPEVIKALWLILIEIIRTLIQALAAMLADVLGIKTIPPDDAAATPA